MPKKASIEWNDRLRIAFADVDETIAEVYTPAEPAMIDELSSYLQDGGKLFMVSGGSLGRIRRDITDRIKPNLRHDILISHCSGAEVWGFESSGELRDQPFYSIYEEVFSPEHKQSWRSVTAQLIAEFGLRTHPAQPKVTFWEGIGSDPLDIMLDDRGPQITMEVVNGIDLTAEQLAKLPYIVPTTHGKHDLRIAIMNRAVTLLDQAALPIEPHVAGMFALDFVVAGANKTTSIQKVLAMPPALATIGLQQADIQNPAELEVWGDKYSEIHGGSDRYMSLALDPTVRSIDFRQEDPAEFPAGYNIVLWDGQQQLHHGLLEYLQSRH